MRDHALELIRTGLMALVTVAAVPVVLVVAVGSLILRTDRHLEADDAEAD